MIKIAHIINPVKVSPTSDLFTAQPITFTTMQRARAYCQGEIDVALYTTQYPEDRAIIPDGFIVLEDLSRSILDIGTFPFDRKLPLLGDILATLYRHADADYFIYTNVDIALQPFFYQAITKLIEQGYDSFVINRRTIRHDSGPVTEDSALLYAQAGRPHPGFDCFIFKKEAYLSYDLGTACIGANWIGRIMVVNLAAYADRFKIFEDLHLTFHLGDDQSWKRPANRAYDNHNLEQLYAIMNKLNQAGCIQGKPLLERFYKKCKRRRKIERLWAILGR